MEDQTFLQKLQGSSHETKMRWLLALSIILGAVAVWVWLAALPAMVALAPAATSENPNPKPQLSGAASIFQAFNQ